MRQVDLDASLRQLVPQLLDPAAAVHEHQTACLGVELVDQPRRVVERADVVDVDLR